MYESSFFDTQKGQTLVNATLEYMARQNNVEQKSVYVRPELDAMQGKIDEFLNKGARLVNVIDVSDYPGKILVFEM